MIYFVGNREIVENTIYEIVDVDKCLLALRDAKEIEVDTETTGFDPYTDNLLSLQFGVGNDQYVIDCGVVDITIFKDIFSDPDKLFLFQNAKFDLRFLLHKGIIVSNVYDTFLVELILFTGYEDNKADLKTLVKKYCNYDLDKTIRGSIHREGLTSRVIKYAAEDVTFLRRIRDSQIERVRELDLEAVVNLENQVVKVFAQIEYNGILINKEKWLEVAEFTEKATEDCEKELDELVVNEPKLKKYVPKFVQGNLFGFEERTLNINWASSKQKLAIVRALGFNTESTDSRFLQKHRKDHPLIAKLIDYNKYNKLSSSFGRNFIDFINPVTGRIHYSVWQILETGRISVSDPNLNQIPSKGDLGKKIRSCFIPNKGYKIVGGDFSGMELRIIAEFSQDPLWVSAFNNGDDLHSVLCAATFDIPIADVKKETPFKKGVTYRDVQKTISFGLSYGMSKFKLADTMDISVEQADEIIKKFFAIVPKVESFLTGLGNLGKKRGYIRTGAPFKRIRWFPQWEVANNKDNENSFKLLGEIERASKNTPIQGSNGDVIKQALIMVQEKIYNENLPVKILLSVYDEIQTECREDFAEEWKVILDNLMKDAAKTVIKSVPIVVDCKISDCWEK